MSVNLSLPIYDVISDIVGVLSSSSIVVIKASTGAGKSTVVPLELMSSSWVCGRRIILVEPRRIAVRSVAYWMAKSLGEKVGQSVGYRVHLDTQVSASTIIEVVTEGVFINKLLSDPELLDTACVIFDEFHERSVDLDLSLCLLRESQEVLRNDLKIVVMSATLDTTLVSSYLGDATIITSLGRAYPVDVSYRGVGSDLLSFSFISDLVASVVSCVIDVINDYDGSVLVFLPGVQEIKRVMAILTDKLPLDILVLPLYGGLKREEQEKAIAPCGSFRKVVLSTSIAESSITIDGVRIVIDSGLIRQPMFNSKNGMDRLETTFVSQASADQRAGRAGRVEPGKCIRLWESYKRLDADIEPGILRGDLTPMVLNFAAWGYVEISRVLWLTSPNSTLFNNAVQLLTRLGCIDGSGITDKGRAVRRLPVHPRLGSMIYEGKQLGMFSSVAVIAAILSERDFISYPKNLSQSDISYRLDVIEGRGIYPGNVNKYGLKMVRDYARSISHKKDSGVSSLGSLLMFAYPDRVAKKMGDGRFITITGAEVFLDDHDTLYSSDYIIVLNSGGIGKKNRVFLAHELVESELFSGFGSLMEWSSDLIYDKDKGIFRLRREYKLGAIVLKSNNINKIPADLFASLMIPYLSKNGLSTLKWDQKCVLFQSRVNFLHSVDGKKFPDFSECALASDLEWLKPYIVTSGIDLFAALKGIFMWDKLSLIDSWAPTHLVVPSGSTIPLDYSSGEPVLKVRLQEMFGLCVTPSVCNGSVPVIIHLLSPASRPIQITRDLKSFWDNTYIEVKKDLKGRYPKHHWPENPYDAIPTNRIKRKKN